MNEDEIRRIHWDDQIGQSRLNVAVETEEMNLFAILKPQLFKEGNQWCVLHGENLQTGIVGFGDTPRKAIFAFNKEWDKEAPSA
jgi:hypothetical protein